MEEKPVRFDEIRSWARIIASRVSDESITHVIGLARGGLVPATIISYALNKPLLTYGVTSYNGTKKSENFHINQSINLKELKEKNASVLVVDDICDTGDTMKHIWTEITLAGIKLKTACIFTKEKHKEWLDHYGLVVPDNKWIVFPWE